MRIRFSLYDSKTQRKSDLFKQLSELWGQKFSELELAMLKGTARQFLFYLHHYS